MRQTLSLYSQLYPMTITYMLQASEYDPLEFISWFWRTNNFSRVMHRKKLVRTKPARVLLSLLRIGMIAQIFFGIGLIIFGQELSYWLFGVALIISYPLVWPHLIILPLVLGRLIIINPKQKLLINEAKKTFAKHSGIKIAIAGSYGKTSMKELLYSVLSPSRKIAATPANKNVLISHARFAKKLNGEEEYLLIEYGEGAPGDIAKFAEITSPDIGIITGIAPAHLNKYPDMESIVEDMFSLGNFVNDSDFYINSDSKYAHKKINKNQNKFSQDGVIGWKVSHEKVDINGTSFTMRKGDKTLKIKSGLLGLHNVGPLALSVALADKFGLSKKQIERNIAKTKPFDHRMQPRLVRGAWIIDDTYNGNIEGMKAGLNLLQSLEAKRRIYVTPGLVDQGSEKKRVHLELGKAIADAKPDIVFLMHNSVTDYIKTGMDNNGYVGVTEIEMDPLNFYLNIEHYLAEGDVVMMQNDWTDNYN